MKTFWLIPAISLFALEVYSMGNIGNLRTSNAKTIVLIDSVDNRISVETRYDNYELWEWGVSPTDFLIMSRMGTDTTCIFSSVGMTRFTTAISEECSSITVFCYPAHTHIPDEGILLIEDFPRGSDDMFPLRFDFSFQERQLSCYIQYEPHDTIYADTTYVEIDSVYAHPQEYVRSLNLFVDQLINHGASEGEIDAFYLTFKEILDKYYLEYGFDIIYYDYFDYYYSVWKACVQYSGKTVVGINNIKKMNEVFNSFYIRKNGKYYYKYFIFK